MHASLREFGQTRLPASSSTMALQASRSAESAGTETLEEHVFQQTPRLVALVVFKEEPKRRLLHSSLLQRSLFPERSDDWRPPEKEASLCA